MKEVNHLAPNHSSKGQGDDCHLCGNTTHYQKNGVVGFLKWLAKKGDDIVTFIDKSLYVNYSLSTWWINSGTIVHVFNSLHGFLMKTNIKKGAKPKVH
jgi:hypothetical protein